jgi:4-hydroxy-3-polyprenylbenzoate decarboxylase
VTSDAWRVTREHRVSTLVTRHASLVTRHASPASDIERFCTTIPHDSPLHRFPLLVIVDDSDFTARTLKNFLWVTFTRSNPAADIFGIDSFIEQKHWGCRGPLVIDARLKPHHAPPLEDDAAVRERVNRLAAPGGPLHGII